MLTSTFDLGDILKKVGYVRKDHSDDAEFEDESMKTALARFQEKLNSEEDNTRKFQSQLLRLLHGDDRTALLERIGKGVALTPRGQRYAHDVRKALTVLGDAVGRHAGAGVGL